MPHEYEDPSSYSQKLHKHRCGSVQLYNTTASKKDGRWEENNSRELQHTTIKYDYHETQSS